MARDIAQEIIDAVKAGKPDYVITKLVQEREDKIQKEGLAGQVPTTSTILSTAAALASAAKNAVSGKATASTQKASAPEPVITQVPAAADPNAIADQVLAKIYDSLENYDSLTYYQSYDYSSSAGAATYGINMSKVVGYAVVGLVLLVVADRLMK